MGLDYYTYRCPIWYWTEFNELYKIIKMYEESNCDLTIQPFILRESIINHKNYIEAVIKYNSEK